MARRRQSGHYALVPSVFLLWHRHEGDEEGKLLGVYSSAASAQRRRDHAKSLPGFRLFPEDFVIDEYEMDQDQWTEGFAIATADGWVDDPDPT